MVIEHDVVAPHEWHEGYELVDVRQLGVPIFRLVISTVVLARTPLSALQSYVLRCVSIGLDSSLVVSETLGLEISLVEKVCDSLCADDYLVGTYDPSGALRYALTGGGDEVLKQDGAIAPQERTEFVEYDGWLRKPIRFPVDSLYTAKQVLSEQGVIFPAIPPKPPKLQELSLTSIEEVLRARGALDPDDRLLEIRRIAKRIIRYRPGTGVLHRSTESDELRLSVVLGPSPSHDHGWKFASSGGLKRTDLIRGVASGPTTKRLRECMGEGAWQARQPLNEFCVQRKELHEARGRVAMKKDALARAEGRASREMRETELAEAVTEFGAVASRIRSHAVRPVSPLEYADLLQEAVRTVQRALLIDTTSMDPLILRTELVTALADKVRSGIRVAIRCSAWFLNQEEGRPPTVEQLLTLCDGKVFTVAPRPQQAVFFLLKDDDFALLTNRPLLRSTPRDGMFQCQKGYLIRDRALGVHARENSGPSY